MMQQQQQQPQQEQVQAQEPGGCCSRIPKKWRRRLVALIFLTYLIYNFAKDHFLHGSDREKDPINFGCVSANDISSGMRAPFVYYKYSAIGSGQQVHATLDPAGSGLCTFTDVDCSEASNGPCCEAAPWATNEQNTSQAIMANLTMLLPMLLPMLFSRCMLMCTRQSTGAREQLLASLRASQEQQPPPESMVGAYKTLFEQWEKYRLWVEQGSWVRRFTTYGVIFVLCIAMLGEPYLEFIKHGQAQRLMKLTDRNAMVLSSKFMLPIEEVFGFLEDSVNVKMGIAAALGNMAAGRATLNVGVGGGFILGVLGAAVVTALSYLPTIMEFAVSPGGQKNPVGCQLLESPEAVAANARLYIILMVWRWPFMFANKAFQGFCIGFGAFEPLLIHMLVMFAESFLQILAWFVIFPKHPNLEVAGLFDLIPRILSFVSFVIIFKQRVFAADEFNVTVDQVEHVSTTSEGSLSRIDSIRHQMYQSSTLWKEASRQGLFSLVFDICTHLPNTIGIYLVGSKLGDGAVYQVAFVESLYNMYGGQLSTLMKTWMKLTTGAMVGKQRYGDFKKQNLKVPLYSFVIVASAAVVTLPFHQGIAFTLSQSACTFASDRACLPMYDSVFGGGDGLVTKSSTVQTCFYVIFPMMLAKLLVGSFRMSLYACCDFGFLAQAGAMNFLFLFLPIFWFVSSPEYLSGMTIQMAMYLPLLPVSLVLLTRVMLNINKMESGQSGPWLENAMRNCYVGA